MQVSQLFASLTTNPGGGVPLPLGVYLSSNNLGIAELVLVTFSEPASRYIVLPWAVNHPHKKRM
jgi:hypothetical protein